MKTKFSGILTLLLALIVQISFAQERTISGVVSDETGPLPGVSVLKKGTTQGTETDFDGKYSIKAKAGDVLVFSFVGMETVEKTVGSLNKIDITMKSGNILEEVVITGMGIKREKKSLGYSQQSVDGESMTKAKEVDVNNALAGRVSGVQIVGNNSSTFGTSKVKLRGEDKVLYVVNGIKVRDASDINPDNIANISVVKGAAGAAIYGPDGRNGVVIITTKVAPKGKTIFEIDHSTTVNSVRNLPEYQNEYGGGYQQTWKTFKYDATKDPESWAAFDGQKIPEYNADESWGPKLDGTLVRHWDSWIEGSPEFGKLRAWSPTPNDIDQFFKSAVTNNTTLSFGKSEGGFNIRTALTYLTQEGIVPNSKRETLRGNLNASYNISDDFNFYIDMNYEDRNTLNNPDQNYGNVGSNFNQWWQRQLDFSRLRNYEIDEQVFSWNIKGPRNTNPLYWDMPFFTSYEDLRKDTKNSFVGKVGGIYDINENLSYKAEIRRTFDVYGINDRATTKSKLNPSSYREFSLKEKKNEFFTMLTYKNNTLIENLDFDINAGAELTNYSLNTVNAVTQGGLTIPNFYNLSGSKDPVKVTTEEINAKNRGFFTTASFGYDKTFYLGGSYRVDFNSAARADNNKVSTFGVSGSFLLHEVLPKNDILTFAKIRLGYAEAPYFPRPYRIISTYEPEIAYQGKRTMSVSTTEGNPNLEGGKKEELEYGLELSFIKNRISLDLTYFDRDDVNIPLPRSLDGSSGYSRIFLNKGEYNSKGFEVGLNGDVIKNDDFSFNLGFNFATLKKTVVNLGGNDSRDLSTYTSRMKLQERVGEEWGLFYGTGFALDKNGNRIIKKSGNKYSYAQQKNKFLGSLLPDFTGGITTDVKYKNFGLSLGFDFQKGGRYYSRTERYYIHSGLAPITAGLNDKGNPKRDPVASGGGVHIKGVLQTGKDEKGNPISDGTVVDTYVNPKVWYNLTNLGNIYENNLHDATYFKLRTIRFNYDFNDELIKKIKLESASIGVFANNVWLISSEIPWIDPSELEKRSEINWAENGTLPSTRNYGVNLKLTF